MTGCKVYFTDGTEVDFNEADLGESQEGDNIYTLNDVNGNIICEVVYGSIKYIKWE